MKYSRFEELPVWQAARALTNDVYEVTSEGKFSKDYRLRDQIRASSTSIMSNIAEGFENQTTRQFIRYLYIAKGSSGELRSQLYVALDAGYLDTNTMTDFKTRTESISRQCSGLIDYLAGFDGKNGVKDIEFEYGGDWKLQIKDWKFLDGKLDSW